jgi:hypothetical protein
VDGQFLVRCILLERSILRKRTPTMGSWTRVVREAGCQDKAIQRVSVFPAYECKAYIKSPNFQMPGTWFI